MQHVTANAGVAIIGAGERGVHFIGSRIAEVVRHGGLHVVGVYDRISARAELAAEYLNGLYAEQGAPNRVQVFASLEDAVSNPAVSLVIVTTHTDGHREPVERAVAHGRRIYLDKPIAVSMEDATAIAAAEGTSGHPIMMGFTRRYEQSWIEAVKLAHGGRIGTPRMVLLRSVIPYTRYLQLWHRNQARSGGALNDKGSHHFDVLNWIAGDARPLRLSAMGGRSGIFAPDPEAPARCRDCNRDCPYRRHETLVDQFEGSGQGPNASWIKAAEVRDRDDNCVYLPGADIDDHAVVTVHYDSGLVATLFFAIFGPWSADQETLEIVGDSGRLRMERHSGEIDLVENYGHARSTIRFSNPDRGSSHYGADRELVRRMQAFLGGQMPPVGVAEGVASLRLVQAALDSLHQGGQMVDLTDGGQSA